MLYIKAAIINAEQKRRQVRVPNAKAKAEDNARAIGIGTGLSAAGLAAGTAHFDNKNKIRDAKKDIKFWYKRAVNKGGGRVSRESVIDEDGKMRKILTQNGNKIPKRSELLNKVPSITKLNLKSLPKVGALGAMYGGMAYGAAKAINRDKKTKV